MQFTLTHYIICISGGSRIGKGGDSIISCTLVVTENKVQRGPGGGGGNCYHCARMSNLIKPHPVQYLYNYVTP